MSTSCAQDDVAQTLTCSHPSIEHAKPLDSKLTACAKFVALLYHPGSEAIWAVIHFFLPQGLGRPVHGMASSRVLSSRAILQPHCFAVSQPTPYLKRSSCYFSLHSRPNGGCPSGSSCKFEVSCTRCHPALLILYNKQCVWYSLRHKYSREAALVVLLNLHRKQHSRRSVSSSDLEPPRCSTVFSAPTLLAAVRT